jgi:hypothetical protein
MPKKKGNTELDLNIYTKDGRLRKRKPKINRNYFTQETENAIIRYINLTQQIEDIIKSGSNKPTADLEMERNRLFSEVINDSLYKLAECIANTFKFEYAQKESINMRDLEHEVVVKIISEFHNYKQSSGKAYSYFGTVAKHYLIQYNDKQYKLQQKFGKDLDDVDGDRKVQASLQEDRSNSDLSEFLKQFTTYIEKTIDGPYNITQQDKEGDEVDTIVLFSEKDKEVVRCLLSFFKNVEELEIFYKPAFYLEMRERTKQRTLDITRVIKIVKAIMKEQMAIFYLEGELDIF